MKKSFIYCAIMLSCTLIISCGARYLPAMADALCAYVSRPAAQALGRFSSFTGLPLAEALLALIIIWGAFTLCRAIIRCVKGASRARIGRWAAGVCQAFCAVLLLYSLLWAPLYHASAQLAASANQVDTAELSALCGALTGRLNALRPALSDELGEFAAPYSAAQVPDRVAEALSRVEGIPYAPAAPKLTRLTKLYKSLALAGIYIPFTGEAIVRADWPAVQLPFVAAHESAHQLGFAREDEASFAAFLACLQGDEYFQYSGCLYALYYAMETLHDLDADAWTRICAQMDKAVYRDYYRMNGLRSVPVNESIIAAERVRAAFSRIGMHNAAHGYGGITYLTLGWWQNGGASRIAN